MRVTIYLTHQGVRSTLTYVSEAKPPKTLLEAVRYFSDIDVATEFVAGLRWASGWECPECGNTTFSYLSTRRLWKCKACKKQSSVKVGTIFEDSPLGLDKWLPSIWLIANSKNGISSYELSRAIGITQKSAWFVLHRIRLAMQTGSFDKFDGEVEADETFIGGLGRNMHKKTKLRKLGGATGFAGMTAVAGVLRRSTDHRPSQVRATVILNTKTATITKVVRDRVQEGSSVYTDGLQSYRPLKDDFKHDTVDHNIAYVLGRVHTNGLENFWALLKRGIHGTYVQVAPRHLNRYVDERAFTFNERDLSDLGRFSLVLHQAAGRRLTWEELTAK
jgi:transposase-like protein